MGKSTGFQSIGRQPCPLVHPWPRFAIASTCQLANPQGGIEAKWDLLELR